PRAIDHVDAIDGPLAAAQIERTCLTASPDQRTHRDIVRLTVGVDHLEVEHLDIVAARGKLDRLEAPFTPADPNGIAVFADEGNLLTAEFHPFTGAPVVVAALRHGIRTHARQRARQYGELLQSHVVLL